MFQQPPLVGSQASVIILKHDLPVLARIFQPGGGLLDGHRRDAHDRFHERNTSQSGGESVEVRDAGAGKFNPQRSASRRTFQLDSPLIQEPTPVELSLHHCAGDRLNDIGYSMTCTLQDTCCKVVFSKGDHFHSESIITEHAGVLWCGEYSLDKSRSSPLTLAWRTRNETPMFPGRLIVWQRLSDCECIPSQDTLGHT